MTEERRVVDRVYVAVCESGHVVEELTEPEPAVQIKCLNGHWAWEDDNYCGACGVALR